MTPLQLDTDAQAPWKERYRAAKYLSCYTSRDWANRRLVVSDFQGVTQLYAYDASTGDLSARTNSPVGMKEGVLSQPDGQYIYYHKDAEGPGSEIGHFVAVPWAGGSDVNLTPGVPPYAAVGLAESSDGSTLVLLTASKGTASIYIRRGSVGATISRVHHVEETVSRQGLAVSADGRFFALCTNEAGLAAGKVSMEMALRLYETATATLLTEIWEGPGCGSINEVHFNPQPAERTPQLVAVSNSSGSRRPFAIWDAATPESTRAELPGLEVLRGELDVLAWSEDATRLLLKQSEHAQEKLWVYIFSTESALQLSQTEGAVWSSAFFNEEGHLVMGFQDARTAPCIVEIDSSSGAQLRTILPLAASGGGCIGHPFKSIQLVGAEGDSLQAWLAVPTHGSPPYPAVLHTHGGPKACQRAVFSPEAQAWLDLGFAYLTVNYHGSTGFGKQFEDSIYGRLGNLEVDDMAACHAFLVDGGVARRDAVFLTGRSYGGYLTLLAAGQRPDLWAGGMGVVAIADWFLMYEDQKETHKGYQRAFFRGSPEDVPEATRASSPITYASAVRAPLLVQQGSNDSACPARQLKHYEEVMRDLGKSLRVDWFEAGHSSDDVVRSIEQQEARMAFALDVLRKAAPNVEAEKV